jgi:hypothetical protein
VDNQGCCRDDKQDVEGKSGDVKEYKTAYPEQDQDNRKR